jgi:hypothetical protein
MFTLLRRLTPALILASLALAAAPVSSRNAGQNVTLKYNWPKGEELRYRIATEAVQTISGVPGLGDMTSTTSASQVHQMTGDAVGADGVFALRVKIESARMKMTSMMMNFEYDSEVPSNDPMAASMAGAAGAMINEVLTLSMAPDGAIRGVDGVDRISAKVQGSPAAAAAAGFGAGLDALPVNDDAVKSSYLPFRCLPSSAVKPGDTWKTEATVPNPLGVQTIASTFTMKGVDTLDGQPFVRIAVTQTIKTAPGGQMGPMSVQVGDASGEGEVLFSAARGRLERATMDVTMPMTMSLAAPDGSMISLHAATQTKTTVELVKK